MKEALEQLISDLKNAPEVVVLAAELGPPASEAALARLDAWFGGAAPADLRQFYAEVGAVQLRWMAAASPRFVGHEAEYARGEVHWQYALFEGVENKKEDGVLMLPPIEVALAPHPPGSNESWCDLMDVEIWIDGEMDRGPVVEEGEFDRDVFICDYSSFYDWPGVFRRTGLVGIGTDYGIDWVGERVTFTEHLEGAINALHDRLLAARRGDTSF